MMYHTRMQQWMPARGRVLDLGCGDNSDLAGYRGQGREVWGVDLQAHPTLLHPEWFRLLEPTGRAPFADGSFDLVGAQWVLEHIRNPRTFLREVHRLLRPGGTFVAVTINALHYVTLLSRGFGLASHRLTQRLVQRLYGRAPHDTFPTFYRLNSTRQIKAAATEAGLRLIHWERVANPDYFSFLPLFRRGAILTDWLLGKISPDLGRLYFVVALQK
jgi:SAM-dependent methyltransferase